MRSSLPLLRLSGGDPGEGESTTLRRLPAHELERAVLARLISFLESPRELLQLFEARTVSLPETNQVVAAAKLKSRELRLAFLTKNG
jgi:hypothetical protein